MSIFYRGKARKDTTHYTKVGKNEPAKVCKNMVNSSGLNCVFALCYECHTKACVESSPPKRRCTRSSSTK